jgi:hypothetical protein
MSTRIRDLKHNMFVPVLLSSIHKPVFISVKLNQGGLFTDKMCVEIGRGIGLETGNYYASCGLYSSIFWNVGWESAVCLL